MIKLQRVFDIKSENKRRAISSLVISGLIIVFQMTGLMINVSNVFAAETPEAGLNTFRMFTTLSNLVLASSCALTIPYQVDGLRKNNYHLPRWIVDLLYIGTFGVTVTFFTAITGIAYAQGFLKAMVFRATIFEHTLNPILAITLFCFISPYHTVKFKKTFLALAPMFLYAIVYFIMAIVIGEKQGGWRDVYMFNAFIPWYITLLMMFTLGFGIATLLRFLHNNRHKVIIKRIENYYLNSSEYDLPTMKEAVQKLARENGKSYKEGDIHIPLRLFKMFRKKYNSDLNDLSLTLIYIESFLGK